MSLEITFPSYNYFLNQVIDWNHAANNPPAAKMGARKLQIMRQTEYTRSEAQETMHAVFAHDLKEIVDGVCDVFVTAGYMAHLQSHKPEDAGLMSFKQGFLPKTQMELIPQLFALREDCNVFGNITHEKVQMLLLSLVSVFRTTFDIEKSVSKVESFVQEVLDSNNSKFIPLQEYEKYKVLHNEYVNKKYEGKFENIVPVYTKLGTRDVVVFRADNGEGKILKPSTFREPKFDLS